jgi:hypothetical protein
LASGMEHPKRLVTLRRDGDDFVVTFYPERDGFYADKPTAALDGSRLRQIPAGVGLLPFPRRGHGVFFATA